MSRPSLVTPVLSAILVGVITVSTGCVGWQPARFEAARQASVSPMEGSTIDVKTANGHVYIEETDQPDVVVDATLKLQTQERADAVDILAEYQPDGTLEVRVLWPDGQRKSNESCAFDITLPSTQGVTVQTSNGAIRLTGLAGEADLRTSNGRVTVVGFDGDVYTHSSNGRIEIERATGRVDAATSNGRVTVNLADDAVGPVIIKSSNGSVVMNTGSAFAGYVSASTSNGSIHVEGNNLHDLKSNRRHASFRVGEANTQSTISTSNGSVTIRVNGG
jgi:DUF4097 and DUF4098 domain-containing protein YvlB